MILCPCRHRYLEYIYIYRVCHASMFLLNLSCWLGAPEYEYSIGAAPCFSIAGSNTATLKEGSIPPATRAVCHTTIAVGGGHRSLVLYVIMLHVLGLPRAYLLPTYYHANASDSYSNCTWWRLCCAWQLESAWLGGIVRKSPPSSALTFNMNAHEF